MLAVTHQHVLNVQSHTYASSHPPICTKCTVTYTPAVTHQHVPNVQSHTYANKLAEILKIQNECGWHNLLRELFLCSC